MILSELSPIDKKHWELHLNAVVKDTPALSEEVSVFLEGGELPKIEHPFMVHDWLEHPEMRKDLESMFTEKIIG